MRLRLAVLCEDVDRDYLGDTSVISLMRVFSRVLAARLPEAMGRFVYVAVVDIDTDRMQTVGRVALRLFDAELRLYDTIAETDAVLLGPANDPHGYQFVVDFSRLPIHEYGDYTFQLTIDDQLIAETRLSVEHA